MVITNKVVIDRDVMDACPELELICIVATGMNNVDLDYAAQKGITVKNVAGYSTESVTQCTFSMLFYLLNSSRYYDDYVKSGQYAASPVFTHLGREFWELKDKLFGIIGMGTIGKRVAAGRPAFGAQVVYYFNIGQKSGRHRLSAPAAWTNCCARPMWCPIHCPLNDQTRNLLTESRLRLMKPTAYLLNMGRGGIVDEAALARVIDENRIAGAALDVLTAEPIAADSPLAKGSNKEKLFITPHIAWASAKPANYLIARISRKH